MEESAVKSWIQEPIEEEEPQAEPVEPTWIDHKADEFATPEAQTANWFSPELQSESETPISSPGTEELVKAWLRGLEAETEPSEGEHFVEPVQEDISSQWQPLEEVLQTTGEPAAPPVETGQVITLTEAQTALMHGHLEAALECYNGFIQNGENLDEVIHDLRDALYRYPVDISIWQTLGDAFARNNQLQEALDAYTKAEELLR